MNRRAFLGLLAAGMTLDPERALWMPGRRTYVDMFTQPPEWYGGFPLIIGHFSDEDEWVDYLAPRYQLRFVENPHAELLRKGRITIATYKVDL